jgi:hypothetical protein
VKRPKEVNNLEFEKIDVIKNESTPLTWEIETNDNNGKRKAHILSERTLMNYGKKIILKEKNIGMIGSSLKHILDSVTNGINSKKRLWHDQHNRKRPKEVELMMKK